MSYIPKTIYSDEYTLEMALRAVGSGWSNLIRECYTLCVDNEINIAQIKEKFGGLRFYVGAASIEILDKIEEICQMSYYICEHCGEDGELRNSLSWKLTLCDKCLGKVKNELF